MRIMFCILAGCVLAVSGSAFAQAPDEQPRPKANFPHSDIFLFDIALDGARSRVTNSRNISNRRGYDNQPFFTNDSETILYTRGDDYQTDIYEYSIEAGASAQITDTPDKEFSPTPNAANTAIAYVSDRDGSVWLANRSAINRQRPILAGSENPEAIGYFAWNERTDDFFYWSRYGYSVILSNIGTLSHTFVSGHTPPSTPRVIPKSDKFSFVHRQTNEQVWIKAFDPETGAVRPLITINGTNHNYIWTPEGDLLTIQDDVLFFADMRSAPRWVAIANLAEQGLANANRLAISPDGAKLAVVAIAVIAAS